MRTASQIHSSQAFHVLIAAAGDGKRFGSNRPKQYTLVHGKTLLRHTLDIFLNHKNLASIRVIINPEHRALYHEAVSGLSLPEPVHGSITRKLSIYNGIKEFTQVKDDEIILIHDAARPLVAHEDINRLIEEARHTGAATLATPITDTLRKTDGETVNRDGVWAIQTPQAFHYAILKKAHERAGTRDATDDSSLVTDLGLTVALVEGSRTNIKITRPEDMLIAQRFLQTHYEVRTGMGFDVHAFERQDLNRPLMLCGVRLDHEYGLAGHSDADVALHAITDALLGALAEGDIGQHFPPSDIKYKNMSSDVFLRHAAQLAAEKGAILQNIDVTIICEAPKIGPYRRQMQARVAEILGIAAEKIGIKATTTERLGFTGRGEGIAAQAVATLKIPEKI